MISFRLRAKWQNCRGYVPRYERTPKNGWFDIHSVFATQLQSAISRFYAPHKPAAKKYAMLLSSGSPDVYGGLEQQYHNMLAFFGAEDLGIRELHGEENKTEAALAEIEAFGASVK